MLSFLALLLFSFAGAGSREIRVLLPRGSPTPARLQVESLDKESQLLREEWIPLDRDRFSLTLPADGVRFRVVGGGFASQALTPSEAAALGAITLEPTGQFRFSGLRGRSESISVLFFPVPVTRPDRRPEPPRPDPIRERKLPRADSRPEGKLSVEAPAGLYLVAVDDGDGLPPAVFPSVELAAGASANLDLRGGPARLLTVVARDRDSRKPLRGARVVVDPKATVSERLLQAVYARRAGSSGEDGRLRLGHVPADAITLTFGAPGHRAAQVRLPAGEVPETRDTLLAPYQTVRVSLTGLPREETRPRAVLEKCDAAETWMPCLAKEKTTRELDPEGRATFSGVAPGVSRVALDWGGGRAVYRLFDVSSLSGDPDTIDIAITLELWRFRGRTLLADDRPVEATITAHGDGNNSSRFGETRSAPDGTFDLSVYVSSGAQGSVGLTATSETPRGRALWHPKRPVADEYAGEDGIEIRVRSGEFRIRLRDRKTDEPIAHCRVSARSVSPGGGFYTTIESDDQGIATFAAIASGSVRFLPHCDGYANGSGTSSQFAEEERREETLLLDRSRDILLSVMDRGGVPVAGAHVEGPDVANSHAEVPGMRINDFFSAVDIGTTGGDGRLLVKGDLWGGITFYVVAAGEALAVSRFPSMQSCEEAPCAASVTLSPPSAFPGLLLRPSPSGQNASSFVTFFETGGVPVPASVIVEALAANGVTRETAFQKTEEGLLCLVPAILADGDYDLLIRSRLDPKTGFRLIPAGRFHLPAARRIELTTPEGVAIPPGN